MKRAGAVIGRMLLRRLSVAVGASALLVQYQQRHSQCRQEKRPPSLLELLDANSHPDRDKVLGKDPDGRLIVLRTIRNGPMRVRVLDWGATITSVQVPDKDGEVGEVTLGFDELSPYVDGARACLRPPAA
jgi:hypothetical protein